MAVRGVKLGLRTPRTYNLMGLPESLMAAERYQERHTT